MSAEPAMAMATGMPVTIIARKDASRCGQPRRFTLVVAVAAACDRCALRPGRLRARASSFDRLLDRVFRPLEQANPRRQFLSATCTERTVDAANPIAQTP